MTKPPFYRVITAVNGRPDDPEKTMTVDQVVELLADTLEGGKVTRLSVTQSGGQPPIFIIRKG
jgi:hypothetical protein